MREKERERKSRGEREGEKEKERKRELSGVRARGATKGKYGGVREEG